MPKKNYCPAELQLTPTFIAAIRRSDRTLTDLAFETQLTPSKISLWCHGGRFSRRSLPRVMKLAAAVGCPEDHAVRRAR